MSKLVKISLSGLIIGFIGMLVSFTIYGEDIFDTIVGDYEVISEHKQVSANDVEIINIDVGGARLHIHSIEGDEIKVDLDARVNQLVNILSTFDVKKSGDELLIKFNQKTHISFLSFLNDTEVNVYVPNKMFDEFNIASSAGRVEVNDINADEVFVESNAGKVILQNIHSNYTTIDIAAGNVDIKSVTGDIEADINAGKLLVQLDKIEQNIALDASAGKVDIILNEEPTNLAVDLKANAGFVNVNDLPLEKKSGNEIKGTIGKGDYLLYVRVDAGSFKLDVK
ncbi:DUF4097 family beta strand repeat-containing protein [Bacillaceae bacterium W0354]